MFHKINMSSAITICATGAAIFSLFAVFLQSIKQKRDEEQNLKKQAQISALQQQLLSKQEEIIRYQKAQTDRLLSPIGNEFTVHYGLLFKNEYYSSIIENLIKDGKLKPPYIIITSMGTKFGEQIEDLRPFIESFLNRVKHPTIIRFVNKENNLPRFCLYDDKIDRPFTLKFEPSTKDFDYGTTIIPLKITIKDKIKSLKDLEGLKVLLQVNLNHYNYKLPIESNLKIDSIEMPFIKLDNDAEIILYEKYPIISKITDIFEVNDFKLFVSSN